MKEVTECFSRLQMKLIIEDMQRLHDIKPFFSRPTLWKTLFKVRTSRLKFSNLILQKSFLHFRFSMSSIFSRSLGHFRIAKLILSIIWNWTERQIIFAIYPTTILKIWGERETKWYKYYCKAVVLCRNFLPSIYNFSLRLSRVNAVELSRSNWEHFLLPISFLFALTLLRSLRRSRSRFFADLSWLLQQNFTLDLLRF